MSEAGRKVPAVPVAKRANVGSRRARSVNSDSWRLSASGRLDLEAAPTPAEAVNDYAELLGAIYDGVLIVDRDGRILEANRRSEEFFRTDAAALCAQNVVDLIAGADTSLLAAVQRNLAAHRYTLIEGRCVRADGKTFPVEIAVSRLRREGHSRLCLFVRDISVHKKAHDELNAAVTRLQEHDRARLQFVSNVSHELKTPLTSMLYAIYNLLNGVVGPLPSRVRRYLQMLDGDCRRMLATVSDILDLRRIDTQTLKLDRRLVPIGRLVLWAVESLRLQAKQKQIDLDTEAGARSLFVLGDAPKLERVVLNVVGNAIKFTPSGGRVTIRLEHQAERGGAVVLRVDDTGIGIPADLLARVTERYFVVGEQPTGTGLGLAISAEIVKLHEGALTVESPPPGETRGTRVSVRLPTAEPPLVMVVEDDDLVRLLLADQLQSWGLRTVTVGEGSAVLETIKRERPDLLLLDLLLPGLEGTDVILKMKANLEIMRTPVVVLTGLKLNEKQQRVLGNFAIPVLTKPWSEEELREHVEAAFLGALATTRRPVEQALKIARPAAAQKGKA